MIEDELFWDILRENYLLISCGKRITVMKSNRRIYSDTISDRRNAIIHKF